MVKNCIEHTHIMVFFYKLLLYGYYAHANG